MTNPFSPPQDRAAQQPDAGLAAQPAAWGPPPAAADSPTGYAAPNYGYASPQAPGYPVPAQAGPQYGAAPAHYAPLAGPLGTTRSTGTAILLYVVTLGFYGVYWYSVTHEEMKRHSGNGIGGAVALVLALFVGIASPFLSSAEVGALYERAGQPKPVSAVTALWLVLGWVILVGPIVWFVKTNGALNAYWRAHGAR